MKKQDIEKSIYIHQASLLKTLKKPDFSRLYFGEEFCPFRLPSADELKNILDFTSRKKLKFTFVTPWLTDETLDKAKKLIKIIPPGNEVIINDYALLPEKKENMKFIPVLGRLLNGQIRGLRNNYKKRLSRNVIDHFRSCQPQTAYLAEFYKEKGFKRVELDNLPQGIKTDFIKFGFSGSLYYPNVYITVTRFCPYLVSGNKFNSVFSVKKCNNECQKGLYYIRNQEIKDRVFVKGNYHFYRNPALPVNFHKLGIDRLVHEIF